MDKSLAPVSGDMIRGNVDTIVLKCLQISDMYGLEICDLVKRSSGGSYVLKQPTLYSSLKRLESQKLISGYWKDSAIGGRRHYYKLSDTGLSKLSAKKGSWSDARNVIDTLVGDLRQGREELLDEQATDKRAQNPQQATGTEKAAAKNADSAGNKKGGLFNSLITEILRGTTYSASDNSDAAKISQIPTFDADAASAHAITIPLTNRKESLATDAPIPLDNPLKPYIFNAEFSTETPSVPAKKSETIDARVLDKNSETRVQAQMKGISGEEVVANDVKEVESLPISFKPKSALNKLNADGEILGNEHESVPRFAKYLSPDDYARATTTVRKAAQLDSKISLANDIFIRPFEKQGNSKFGGDQIFISRVRLVGALVVALAVACGLFLIRTFSAPHNEGENAFFTTAYIILASYVAVNIVIFAISPSSTRKAKYRWENTVLRLGVFFALAVVVLGINILGGLTTENVIDYIVYLAVPCIVASIIIIEGGLGFLFLKLKIFST